MPGRTARQPKSAWVEATPGSGPRQHCIPESVGHGSDEIGASTVRAVQLAAREHGPKVGFARQPGHRRSVGVLDGTRVPDGDVGRCTSAVEVIA